MVLEPGRSGDLRLTQLAAVMGGADFVGLRRGKFTGGGALAALEG